MKKLFLTLALALSTSTLLAQEPSHTSTITLSVGGQPYSYNHFGERGGPAVSGRYEFRLSGYFALETGIDTLLPTLHSAEVVSVISAGQNLISVTPNCSVCVIVPLSERTRDMLLPFGAKGILPIASGRVELFVGFGGAYAWHSDYRQSLDALLAQGSLGGRLALDRKRHFWLGTSLRGYSNFGYNRQEWLSWTADFGFRFGH